MVMRAVAGPTTTKGRMQQCKLTFLLADSDDRARRRGHAADPAQPAYREHTREGGHYSGGTRLKLLSTPPTNFS